MIDNFTDGIRLIILDLSGVTFLDVVGVKALRRVCNHQIVSCINNPCCLFRRVWRYQKAIKISTSKKNRQHNGQKDKQRSNNNKFIHQCYKGYRVRVFKLIQSKYILLHQLSRV